MMDSKERLSRYKGRILNCCDRAFVLARKVEAMGVLLEKGSSADEHTSLYGLGLTLASFGEELSAVYRDLDQVATRLHHFIERMPLSVSSRVGLANETQTQSCLNRRLPPPI